MDSENEMRADNNNYIYIRFIAGCVFRHWWRAVIRFNHSYFLYSSELSCVKVYCSNGLYLKGLSVCIFSRLKMDFHENRNM